MTEKKQIEEMAKEMCKHCAGNESPCSVAKSGNVCKSIQREAEALYNADYRKQIAGEWIYSEDEVGKSFYRCSICDCQTRYRDNYCPKCGARMKGDEGDG